MSVDGSELYFFIFWMDESENVGYKKVKEKHTQKTETRFQAP
jgi:hypothetical protein